MSALALGLVAVLHAIACADFVIHGQFPMACVMFGFFVSDCGLVWYALA